MKIRTYNSLTWDVVSQFGNRKEPGRVSVLVDVRKSNGLYAIPMGIEHVDFIKSLAKPKEYPFIIPSHIDLKFNSDLRFEEVWRIVTGVSGVEISMGVRHAEQDMYKAHRRVIQFIQDGEAPHNIKEEEIVRRYCL